MRLDYFQPAFFFSRLLGEETGGEGLLHVRRDENAAEAMFGFGATMDTNATASRNLTEDGQEALELGAHRHLYLVNQGGDEIVGVFQRVADVMAAFGQEACALVEIARGVI